MRIRPVRQLSDPALILETRELAANDRVTTAQLLVHLGEIDRRKLFAPAGYPSMYQYCIQEFLMSEDVASKRIRVSRLARRFPRIIPAIHDGRLNLNSLVLLGKYLTRENGDELLKAAEFQRRSGIELLLARQFPQPDLPTLVEPTSQNHSAVQAARPVESQPLRLESSGSVGGTAEPVMSASVEDTPMPPARVAPLAPERFGLQTTIDRETHELLRRAQELLGHQVAAGDVAEVLKRALSTLVMKLEKQKFAATEHPKAQKARKSNNARHIPNAVKREVWKRDRAQCTFIAESGRRCEERRGLEFDHIDPVARGGTSTVRNLRLRCPAHNQFEADRVFGAEFMNGKRGQSSRPGTAASA